MDTRMIRKFNEDEIEEIISIATEMAAKYAEREDSWGSGEDAGVARVPYCGLPGHISTFIPGIMGEIAFGEYYDLEPDLTVRDVARRGSDFNHPRRGRTDVKTRRYPTGFCDVRHDLLHDYDIVVFGCMWSETEVELEGWLERESEHWYPAHMPRSGEPCLRTRMLHPMEDL